jgi:hypothetical protein
LRPRLAQARHDLQVGPNDLNRGFPANAAFDEFQVRQHRQQLLLFGFFLR